MSTKPKLLVVDARPTMVGLLAKIVRGDAEVIAATDASAAIDIVGRERIAMVLCDLELASGLAVLSECKRVQPSAVFVLMAGPADHDASHRASRLGAYDTLTKPVDSDDLRAVVLRGLGRAAALGEDPAGSGPENGELLPGIVGRSPALRELADLIRQLAPTSRPVVILGEPGTGKQRIARALHALGDRAGRFVTLDCSAIPGESLDRELFGHATRPGLLEQADGGTLFLDHIADLPASLQGKLSTWSGPRLIAASDQDLEAMVREGTFRRGLWDAISDGILRLPPLRERREDVPLLARRFLADLADKRPDGPHEFSPSALAVLRSASWPGNVRQLREVVEHAARLAEASCIDTDDLPPDLRASPGSVDAGETPELTWQQAIDHARDRMAPDYLRTLLAAAQGNVVNAANQAGIERESFYRLLRKYGVRADQFRRGG